MEEAKKHLEDAVATSSASNYEKGNLLYLAENYADIKAKVALETIAQYETSNA
jgi:hypothetical protein